MPQSLLSEGASFPVAHTSQQHIRRVVRIHISFDQGVYQPGKIAFGLAGKSCAHGILGYFKHTCFGPRARPRRPIRMMRQMRAMRKNFLQKFAYPGAGLCAGAHHRRVPRPFLVRERRVAHQHIF